MRGEVDVCDLALITYLVPAERLERLLFAGLELQTITWDETSWAFVSASCFLNHEFRWTPGPSPTWTFHQSTYRTYVRRGADVGTFFLASYVETLPAALGQKLGLAETRTARFEVDIDRDPAGGYRHYRAAIHADKDRAHLELTATDPPAAPPPFDSADQHVRFLTHRLHGYAYSLVGAPIDAPVVHDEMAAYGGRLIDAYFPPLEVMGLVDPEQQRQPHSVLVAPGTRFQLLPPIPAPQPRTVTGPIRVEDRRHRPPGYLTPPATWRHRSLEPAGGRARGGRRWERRRSQGEGEVRRPGRFQACPVHQHLPAPLRPVHRGPHPSDTPSRTAGQVR